MIIIDGGQGWALDDNGTNVMTKHAKHVVDLHNDCEVRSVTLSGSELRVVLVRVADYTQPSLLRVGETINLVLSNIQRFSLDGLDLPTIFEGIYDYSDTGLSLCLGERCFQVEGSNIRLRLNRKLSA